MIWVNTLFTAFLFLAVWQGIIVLGRMIYKEKITCVSLLTLAIGITGVITHIIGIW